MHLRTFPLEISKRSALLRFKYCAHRRCSFCKMSALPPVADITGQAKAVRAELPRLWLDRLLCSLGTDSAGCSTGWLNHGALSHARHYCA
jgi:hypothetical protein